jgi:hypothetical protein
MYAEAQQGEVCHMQCNRVQTQQNMTIVTIANQNIKFAVAFLSGLCVMDKAQGYRI